MKFAYIKNECTVQELYMWMRQAGRLIEKGETFDWMARKNIVDLIRMIKADHLNEFEISALITLVFKAFDASGEIDVETNLLHLVDLLNLDKKMRKQVHINIQTGMMINKTK